MDLIKSSENFIDPLLLSNFIHQVINPLNGVIGTLDNLIDGTVTDKERYVQRLHAVRGQLANSIEMIRNLAFLSQLYSEEGVLSLRQKLAEVNLPTLIIEAIQFFQERGQKNKISIELTDRKSQYYVMAHTHLFRQVILNLLDNAIKYSFDSTKIEITPRVQKSTSQLIINIINYGIGFDYHDRKNIFELGFRAKEAKDKKASGSGIGLFICKRIIETVHEGKIEAEHSEKTSRTNFQIRIPKENWSIK